MTFNNLALLDGFWKIVCHVSSKDGNPEVTLEEFHRYLVP